MMLKRNVAGLALSVVLFLLLIVVRVTAQGIPQGAASADTGLGGVNSISGMVVSSSGQRIARRVSIRLRTMTRGDRISTTDDGGNFVFRGVPAGDYVVAIEKEQDFEPFTQNVSVIQPRGMPPQNYYLSIRLSLKGRGETRTGVLNAEFANVPPRARASYEKALELAQAGNNKAAIEQLKQAISDYPNFMLAFNELGVQYLRLGELDKADEALAKALKLAPDSATPLLTHGILLTVQGKFNLAVTELQAALKQKDQSAIGHLYLGQALAVLGRFADAEAHLTRAVALGGDEVKDAHRFLGAIYFQQGEREKGIAEFETYLKLAPKAKDAEQVRNMIRQNKRSQNHVR
jgi:tetratricopeptide (TPR) repeat protein